MNIPIGIFTVILTYLVCPADKRAVEKQKIDYLGAFFLILDLFGFILALNQSQNWGVTSSLFLGVLAGGILALIILYFIEKKTLYPVVNFSLFAIRNFSTNSFGRLVAQLVFIPPLFFIPIYLQNIVRFDPSVSGLTVQYWRFVVRIICLHMSI